MACNTWLNGSIRKQCPFAQSSDPLYKYNWYYIVVCLSNLFMWNWTDFSRPLCGHRNASLVNGHRFKVATKWIPHRARCYSVILYSCVDVIEVKAVADMLYTNAMILLTHRCQYKMAAISRRHFQMYFLEWKLWMSIKILLKFFPKGPINNILSFVQIMAWRRPGDNPLSEQIVYWRILKPLGLEYIVLVFNHLHHVMQQETPNVWIKLRVPQRFIVMVANVITIHRTRMSQYIAF